MRYFSCFILISTDTVYTFSSDRQVEILFLRKIMKHLIAIGYLDLCKLLKMATAVTIVSWLAMGHGGL